jgi:hypothetical protein
MSQHLKKKVQVACWTVSFCRILTDNIYKVLQTQYKIELNKGRYFNVHSADR